MKSIFRRGGKRCSESIKMTYRPNRHSGWNAFILTTFTRSRLPFFCIARAPVPTWKSNIVFDIPTDLTDGCWRVAWQYSMVVVHPTEWRVGETIILKERAWKIILFMTF